MLRYSLLIFITVSVQILFGRDFTSADFRNFSIYDGMPSNEVRAFCKDSLGYVWLATIKGVSRVVGSTYENYQPARNKPYHLSGKRIQGLVTDHNGIVWVGHENGVDYFDYNVGSFQSLQLPPELSGNIVTLAVDSDGSLLIMTLSHLYRFVKQSNDFQFIQSVDTERHNRSFNSILIVNDTLWIGLWNGGILELTPTMANGSYNVNHYLADLKNANVLHLSRDGNATLIMSMYNRGVGFFNMKTKELEKELLPDTQPALPISSVKFTLPVEDNIFIGFDNAPLCIYHKPSQTLQFVARDYNAERSYKGFSAISGMFSDGLIFIGTRRGYHKALAFTGTIDAINGENSSVILANQTINGISENDGNIWLATNFGYGAMYNLNQKSAQSIKVVANRKKLKAVSKDPVTGKIWFTAYAKELVELDLKTGKVKTYPLYYKGNGLVLREMVHMNNYLFIASSKGLVQFDKIQGKIDSVHQFNRQSSRIKDEVVTLKTYEDGLLILGAKSLIYMNKDLSVEKLIILKDRNSDRFNDIALMENKAVICGNDSLHFVDLNTNRGVNKAIPYDGALAVSAPGAITFDKMGDVWFADERKLYCYKIKEGVSYSFDARRYLSNYGFNDFAICLMSNGEIAIGGKLGLSIFQPDALKQNVQKQRCLISRIYLLGEEQLYGVSELLSQPLHKQEKITLEHWQNSLAFELNVLDYMQTEANQYAYMLEGHDADWTFLGNSNRISFANLSPGEYNLAIRGQNATGIWSDVEELVILVKPPFYRTVWFILIVTVILLLAFFAYVRLRTLQVNRRNKQLNRIVKERTFEIIEKKEELRAQNDQINKQKSELELLNKTKDRLFSIISHDLKNPFHAISGFTTMLIANFQQYSTLKKLELLHIIRDSADDAYKLFENLLNWSRSNLNVVQCKIETLDLQPLVDDSLQLLKPQAIKKGIELKSTLTTHKILGDRNMIDTVIRNLVANAIKFTAKDGIVKISVSTNNKLVEICIEDSGVGMSPEVQKKLFRSDEVVSTKGTEGEGGTGIGLILCQDFVTRNNGQISVQSEEGKGSVFTVALPKP